MCGDGRLQPRELANVIHAVAKMSVAGQLVADDASVQDTLAALEKRVVLVASRMNPQAGAYTRPLCSST
jgi:hypothetical protein